MSAFSGLKCPITAECQGALRTETFYWMNVKKRLLGSIKLSGLPITVFNVSLQRQ